MYVTEGGNNTSFFVAFTRVDEETKKNIYESVNRCLKQDNIDPIEPLMESLDYRFKNNNWTGLTLPYTNNETGRIISVVLINLDKIVKNAVGNPRYFLLNVLSHELRHLVDYTILESNPITEVKEEPAYMTGSLTEYSMQFYEECLQKMSPD